MAEIKSFNIYFNFFNHYNLLNYPPRQLWTVGAGGISLPSVASSETGASHSKQNLVLEKFRVYIYIYIYIYSNE